MPRFHPVFAGEIVLPPASAIGFGGRRRNLFVWEVRAGSYEHDGRSTFKQHSCTISSASATDPVSLEAKRNNAKWFIGHLQERRF